MCDDCGKPGPHYDQEGHGDCEPQDCLVEGEEATCPQSPQGAESMSPERPALLVCDKSKAPPCLFDDDGACIVHGGRYRGPIPGTQSELERVE